MDAPSPAPRDPSSGPPRLLPGRSQISYMRVGMASLGVGVVGLVAMVGGTLLFENTPSVRQPLVLLTGGPAVAASFVMLWAAIGAWLRARREAAAGYTTAFGQGMLSGRPYYELWQLDDKTGEVLRRPGER